MPGRERDDGGRINAAAEKDAERHVCHKTSLARAIEQLPNATAPFLFGICRDRLEWLELELPVTFDPVFESAGVKDERAAARQLVDTLVNGERRRDVAIGKVLLKRTPRNRSPYFRMLRERGSLGPEDETAVIGGIIKRLLAEPIATAEELTFASIEN